jgi:uncharacterized protein
MAFVQIITIYPIKSLDGVNLKSCVISEKGTLRMDRAWVLKNTEGRTVNAKKYPTIQKIRAYYDPETWTVRLSVNDQVETFAMWEEKERMAQFFSDYFTETILIENDISRGFPDDDENNGPTIVSTRTYEELLQWFPHLDLDDLRLRFRANIELGDCPVPFWEDRLFSQPGGSRRFTLGDVEVIGKNPCPRCAVPTRNPLSGEREQDFMHQFTKKRREKLPAFAPEAQFDHYYRLCVNTLIPDAEAGKELRVGDSVKE